MLKVLCGLLVRVFAGRSVPLLLFAECAVQNGAEVIRDRKVLGIC